MGVTGRKGKRKCWKLDKFRCYAGGDDVMPFVANREIVTYDSQNEKIRNRNRGDGKNNNKQHNNRT